MFKSNSFLKVELISKQITDGKLNFSELFFFVLMNRFKKTSQ